MFEEIEREKEELPKLRNITNEMSKQTFNGYQKFAIITFLVCFCFGIILGNLFPACGSSSNFMVLVLRQNLIFLWWCFFGLFLS